MTDLRKAAQAVVDRWDTPSWKDVPATAIYIEALRQALAQPEQGPVAVGALSVRYFRGDKAMTDTDFEYFGDLPEGDYTLYISPPKREWKGLTSDDKHFLLANAWNKEQAFDGFMKAIDRFLEEKNT